MIESVSSGEEDGRGGGEERIPKWLWVGENSIRKAVKEYWTCLASQLISKH